MLASAVRDSVEGNPLLSGRLNALQIELHGYVPAVDRVAVALYDAGSDTIKTFLSSPRNERVLAHYRIPLARATWLDELRRSRRSRLVESMRPATLGGQRHSRELLAAGFKSSYTVPLFADAGFLGFVFFNSRAERAFSEAATRQLDLFARIVGLAVESALRSTAVLTGSLAVLRQVSRLRDEETADHLARMSCYTELIALAVAPQFGLDDEWAEYLRLYAPLHDIGKIAIPDAVMHKPGPLEPAEFETMKSHAASGADILAGLIRALELEAMPHISSLLDIARHHHEAWDGSGYPDGLIGSQIPLAARIVRVADAFDALLSRRPYKEPWPIEEAFAHLRGLSGVKFDPQCVEALVRNRPEVEGIACRFGA